MIQRHAGLLALIALLFALVVLHTGWSKLLRELPQQIPEQLADDSLEEYFEYGSVGNEHDQGVPFWIFLALPNVFPEYLPAPGGYAALGFEWRRGRQLPVGFSRKTIGFERVGANCAVCHGATVQRRDQGYQRFLFECASDPRFNSTVLMQEIGRVTKLSWLDSLLYRFVLIPQTRSALLRRNKEFAWTNPDSASDRGRLEELEKYITDLQPPKMVDSFDIDSSPVAHCPILSKMKTASVDKEL